MFEAAEFLTKAGAAYRPAGIARNNLRGCQPYAAAPPELPSDAKPRRRADRSGKTEPAFQISGGRNGSAISAWRHVRSCPAVAYEFVHEPVAAPGRAREPCGAALLIDIA